MQEELQKIAEKAKGKVGIYLAVMESGEKVGLNEKQRFPMQSVYKFPIAMAVLHQVDTGRLKLGQKVPVRTSDFISPQQHSPIRDAHPKGVSMSISDLLRFMVSESDGTACDVLLRVLGGTSVATRYLQGLGINQLVVATTEQEMGKDEMAQYRSWATPVEAARLLQVFYQGKVLSPANRALLLRWMIESPTGPHRIKGLLPSGTVVAHKTGTSGTIKGLTRATNDIGIVTLPDGRHLIVAAFVSDSPADQDTREAVIAKSARLAWDQWK